MLRRQMTMMAVLIRLSWGNMTSPLNVKAYVRRFFPTPRISIYKKALVDYFFRN